MWYQDHVNLYESKLIGPFDFEDGFKVPQHFWKALLDKAKSVALYTGAINRVVALDKPDCEDKDTRNEARSLLAFRWTPEGQHE